MQNQDDWNWDQSKNDSVVLPSVKAIAVYTNRGGDIVIRQEESPEDSVVVIPRKMAETIARAIRAEAKKEIDPE